MGIFNTNETDHFNSEKVFRGTFNFFVYSYPFDFSLNSLNISFEIHI